MPKNHISNPYTENTDILESKNRKSSYQNRNIEIGITEAEIRIEAKQLSRKIVTALLHSAVPQPGRLLQQPYIASIGVTPGAKQCYVKN